MKIPESTKDWLLNSDIPYIRYNAAILFAPKTADKSVLADDPLIRGNIEALQTWNETPLERHDKPDLNIHRLALIADLGADKDFAGMDTVIGRILAHVSPDGIPLVNINIPTVFGGTGAPSLDWVMTDFPTVLYGLLKLGVRNELTAKAVKKLEALTDSDGYHCVSSIPKFKGPGPRTSICPYANLIAAKALSEDPGGIKSPAAKLAVDTILRHWDERGQKKYFLFGVGTDYKKLKFPFIWYNILHTLETVSRYENYREDKRVLEMAEIVQSKADSEMRFKPESIYMAYKGRDFADKKQVSPTITLFTLRILMRLGLAG